MKYFYYPGCDHDLLPEQLKEKYIVDVSVERKFVQLFKSSVANLVWRPLNKRNNESYHTYSFFDSFYSTKV